MKSSCRESGFTIIEVVASLMIFSVVTIGLVPLLASSMQAANRARAGTVGKNLVVEAMEHIRGLPYFISIRGQRVDVLDLYYPEYVATGVYRTECTPTTVSPGCAALDVPEGYTLTIEARFVQPDSTGGYTTVVPPTSYIWDWDTGSTAERRDSPRTQLLQMTIEARWETIGRPRTFSVISLVGAKDIDRNKINGISRVDYGIQVRTAYDTDVNDTANPLDDLTVTAGAATSTIGARLTSTSNQTIDGARLRLVRRASGTDSAVSLGSLDGVVAGYQAPPDQTSIAAESAALGTLTHPDLGLVATIDATIAENARVEIGGELPRAEGDFGYSVATTDVLDDLTVRNQLPAGADPRLLDSSKPNLAVVTPVDGVGVPTGDPAFTGGTATQTGGLLTTARRVQAQANVFIDEIRLLPTSFAPNGVVVIRDFTASVDCNSTTTTTAEAAISWSADVLIWTEATAGYIPQPITVNGGDEDTPGIALTTLTGNDNPLVRDSVVNTEDVYLFQEGGRIGYLTGWSSRSTAAQQGRVSNNNRVTTASLEGAISISTAPRAPNLAESGLSILIGGLSCRAEDFR